MNRIISFATRLFIFTLIAAPFAAANAQCSLDVQVASTPVSCYNSATGSITANVTGGSGNYTYYWNNGYTTWTTQTIAGVPAGSYNLIVRDAANTACNMQRIITLDNPEPLNLLSLSKTRYNGFDLSCSNSTDGQITVTASGGVAPYTYSLNGGNFQSSNVFSNLGAGTYYAAVKDALGCTITNNPASADPSVYVPRTVTLTPPSPLTVTPIVVNPTSVLATGVNEYTIYLGYATQTLTLWAGDITGGAGFYTYSWSPADSLTDPASNVLPVTPTRTTTYTLTVADANGCTNNSSVTINVINLSGGGTDTTGTDGGGTGGGTPGKSLTVCHNGITLRVDRSALNAHMRHGDVLGACNPSSPAARTIPGLGYEAPATGANDAVEPLLHLSPNPTTGRFTLRIDGKPGTKAELTILNAAGVLVEQRTVLISAGNLQNFNLQGRSGGLYILRIVTAGGKSTTARVILR